MLSSLLADIKIFAGKTIAYKSARRRKTIRAPGRRFLDATRCD
jgi:hypothetical protein